MAAMLLAIEPASWGIIATAGLGLAGIVATFFAPTWSQKKLEERREERELRRARRLAINELETAHRQVGSLRGRVTDRLALPNDDEARRETLGGLFGGGLRVAEWETHRSVLAADVADEVWDRVVTGYRAIWTINEAYSQRIVATDAVARHLGTAGGQIERARDALAAAERNRLGGAA